MIAHLRTARLHGTEVAAVGVVHHVGALEVPAHHQPGVGAVIAVLAHFRLGCCCPTPNPQPSVCSLPPGLGVRAVSGRYGRETCSAAGPVPSLPSEGRVCVSVRCGMLLLYCFRYLWLILQNNTARYIRCYRFI